MDCRNVLLFPQSLEFVTPHHNQALASLEIVHLVTPAVFMLMFAAQIQHYLA